MTMRGKMVHKFLDRADEQRKEAEVVRLRTPLRAASISLAPALPILFRWFA